MAKTWYSSKKSPFNPPSATMSLHSCTEPISTESSVLKSVAKNLSKKESFSHCDAVDCNDNQVAKKAWNYSILKLKRTNSLSDKNHHNVNNVNNDKDDDSNDNSDKNIDYYNGNNNNNHNIAKVPMKNFLKYVFYFQIVFIYAS